MIKFILANWKTTLAGIGTFATAFGHLANGLANGDTGSISTDLPLIFASIGLLFAKDWNVSGTGENTGIAGPKQ